jgi:hypothetical protein
VAILRLLAMRVSDAIAYADYFFEVALLAYLLIGLFRRRSEGLAGITAYMLASVGLGGLRMYAAFNYGPQSRPYAAIYWLTDYALVFAVFLLIVSFFHRALADRPEAWRRVRPALVSVFILTGAVSCAIITYRGYSFFPYFVVEFQQDLYFACLVLTTALYLTLVKFEPMDDQFGLLVAGLGMMFAGFAVSFALFIVGGGSALSGLLTGYIAPLFDIAMVSIWFYAAARVPMRALAREEDRGTREVLPFAVLARTILRS